MPADYDELFSAYADLTGTSGEAQQYYAQGDTGGGFEEWRDLFMSTGIDFESHDLTVTAFEDFLMSFYPQGGMSGDDWFYIREEFYDLYDISDHDIDWEAYREAIGYGRT